MKKCLHVVLAGCINVVLSLAAASSLAAGKTADDYLQTDQVVAHGSAANHVRIYAADKEGGEYVVIVPSLGRSVEDYTEMYNSTITTRLAEAGYRVVLIQPRGVGKSTGDLTPQNASMSMFAQDIKAVLDSLKIKHANFIGHAFGNRLARTYATLYPNYVDHLVLMASGGNFEMSEEQKNCLRNSLNLGLPDKERATFLKCAFFAKGNDPRVWLTGWYPALAKAQILATTMINDNFFKKAGNKPFLLIQGKEDFIAPPELAGRTLKQELGDQVTYVEIPDAGHAMSSEQPDLIAQYIIDYFKNQPLTNQ